MIKKPEKNYANGDLEVEFVNSTCLIKLNRPKALNALSHDMIKTLKQVLIDTKDDPDVRFYNIYSCEESPLFCAGGDVKSLYKEGVPVPGSLPIVTPESMKLRRHFFRDEYTTFYMISQLEKDFIAYIGKDVIGGGVGLITHGSKSIMNELAFASMPECTIGFFPDVGSGAFLGWLPHSIGTFIGLCGFRLKGADAEHVGIATLTTKGNVDHFIDRSSYGTHMHGLLATKMRNIFLNNNFPSYIFQSIINLSFGPIEASLINDIFSKCRVEDILLDVRNLAMNENQLKGLWTLCYNNLCNSSPTSLKVTLRYLQLAKELSLQDIFKYEYRIASNFMRHPDFYEGICAKLVEKRKPKWNPPFLDDVTEAMVDKFFELPEGEEDLDVVKELAVASSIK